MKLLDKIIQWGLSTLNKWHLKRIDKYDLDIPNNDDNYEALIPNTQDKKETVYSNPFTVALKTPNVNNIAITGSYGSGKSSFLRRFEKENIGWNYLPISLATFTDTKNDEVSNSDNNEAQEENETSSNLHQDIERSILQQFFYREKDNTIPFSRFKKIKKVSKTNILLLAISISYLYSYIFRPKVIQNLLSEKILNFTHEFNYIFLVLALLLFFGGLYQLLYFLGSFQVSKFDIKKNSITVAQQDKASILNEHLDEILYFFEATNYNVVIFEDIDRFNNTEIFVKLRELNNLINNSKQVNRRVIFVYAIRDDMFIDKERTKFFDFIVPIIPYINPSNSEQKLIDKFKKEIEKKKIDEHFLSQLSWYIDDMRLLINIYNEYIIYKKNLNSNNLDRNKLLALIVCKNFYPLDFAKLHVREGAIYELFKNKPSYITKQVSQFNNEKIELLKQIKEIQSENIKSLDELKIIYLGRLFAETNADAISILGTDYSKKTFNDLLNSDILDKINSSTSCEIYNKICHNYRISFNRTKQQTFGKIENLIDKNNSYLQRKELIENKSNNTIDDLKKEIENIDKTINRLNNSSLKELFRVASEYIATDDYDDRDLLIFLVRNGYIDEHYEHYISYFHEGAITQDDREFLLSIQNHKPLAFTAQLGNVTKLLDKLDEKSFDSENILNNQLTNYLLEFTTPERSNERILNAINKSIYFLDFTTPKKEKYFKQVSNGSDKSIEFIFQYMEYATDEEKNLFLKQLSWDGLWQYIYDNLSSKEQNRYFKLLFNALDVNRLVELDMSSYLAKQTILPKYTEKDNKKCRELIDQLNVSFMDIKNPSDNLLLFNYIYKHGHYVFSPKMIEIIMQEKGNVESSEINDLKYKNLTIIRESKAENLIQNIDENIKNYLENVFFELDENNQESEDTLIYLLNHKGLCVESKKDIINKTETKISNITFVKNKESWEDLFKENKISASWDNILYYYQNLEEPKIDDTIIAYLNIENNYVELSEQKINNEAIFDKSKILNPFNTNLLLSKNLTDKAYTYLIKSIWFIGYENLALDELSMSKVENILSTNRLSLTQNNINRLKDNFSPKHIDLIVNKKEDFLENFDDYEVDANDVLEMLNSTKFSIDEKFKIIENINLTFFDDSLELKEKVSKLCIDKNKNIENIELFDKLFYEENQYDLELLISQLDYFDDCKNIKPYLEALEGEGYKELVDISAKPHYIKDSDLNKQLLRKLENKGCISSWKKNKKPLGKNNLKVERKRRRKGSQN
ncbi:MAG: hypothetical protein LGB54_04775 [Sulfurovum sp.]|nr:hypothetical protein [Sulfurovum sp.]